MKTTERTGPDEQPLSQDILYAVRYYLGGRTGLLVLIGAVLAAGLALNWSWLLAIGVAPLLLALAPCAIMGALGLCGARTTGQSCGSQTNAEQIDPPVRTMAKTPSGALPSAWCQSITRPLRSVTGCETSFAEGGMRFPYGMSMHLPVES